MQADSQNYCEHFQYLKITPSFHLDKQSACKFCLHGPSQLWMCLAKGCGAYVCAKNKFEHLSSHLEQSRRQKKFHSVFISTTTAQIRCVQCNIQIKDLDIQENDKHKHKQDPFPIRTKVLPGLLQLSTHKIQGQLQNPQGHRKISKGLVGIFSNKYNHTINAAIQFISHNQFFRQLILQLKVNKTNKIIFQLQSIVKGIDSARYRAIHSDVLMWQTSQNLSKLLYQEMPWLLGYKRKDPFDMVLYLLAAINQETIFYTPALGNDVQEIDEWDLFYRKNGLITHHMIYNSIQSTLSLNYYCLKCKKNVSMPHNIQFLKLNITKKKRKAKQVQKQLLEHRYTSPVKNRRKSLMNLFKQQQCPLTIPQLIIQLMKSPLHKQANCSDCGQPLLKAKLHFAKLPDILIIQIARMGKQGAIVDETPVQLSTQPLDMGSFTSNTQQQIFYDFESAVCIEQSCLFPLLVVGQHNKQKYLIRNETVQMTKQNFNPYLLCYKKRPSASALQKLTMINDDLVSNRQKNYILPDFWYLQLQNGIQKPLLNQFLCRHRAQKPNITPKSQNNINVSKDVYQDLHHFYNNPTNLSKSHIQSPRKQSPKMHRWSPDKFIIFQQKCQICAQQCAMLQDRRKKQKQYVLYFDKLKTRAMPLCMISNNWLKKWSNYLYNKASFSYMPKGYPLPPAIDNKNLLQGPKCKANLVRNQDYKIINIYLWKFLKEIYGGGPQIRYRWKQSRDNLDEELLSDIRSKVTDLKFIYTSCSLQSPKKLTNSVSYIQKSTILQSQSQTMHEQTFQLQEDENEQ